jgi:hypothetical protein
LFALVAVVAVVAVFACEAEVANVALVANEAVPVKFPTKVVEVTEVNPAKVVTVVPKFTTVEPIIDPELSKLVFGIAAKPNVKVSDPASPTIVRPCPDDDTKFKDPEGLSAIKIVPPIEADANAFLAGNVADVTYPASLFNCDTLLPDTTTFFQFAILFYIVFMLINIKF